LESLLEALLGNMEHVVSAVGAAPVDDVDYTGSSSKQLPHALKQRRQELTSSSPCLLGRTVPSAFIANNASPSSRKLAAAPGATATDTVKATIVGTTQVINQRHHSEHGSCVDSSIIGTPMTGQRTPFPTPQSSFRLPAQDMRSPKPVPRQVCLTASHTPGVPLRSPGVPMRSPGQHRVGTFSAQ
jgi:hypothetical protein